MLRAVDAGGRDLGTSITNFKGVTGEWTFAHATLTTPDDTAGLQVLLIANGYQNGGSVSWDDVAVFRLP